MSLPYPEPVPVKTARRCQFSLTGRKYNCRRIGKYVLVGKHYCACHYDIAWKVLNPVYGKQHEWHVRIDKFTSEPWPYPTCRRCGEIQPHDGFPQSPCRGHQDRITLMTA